MQSVTQLRRVGGEGRKHSRRERGVGKGVEKREEDRYTCSQRKLFVTREHTQYSNAATVQEAIHSQVVMTVKMN